MKYLFILLFCFNIYGYDSDFVEGYEDGFNDGYCDRRSQITCYKTNNPVAPVPKPHEETKQQGYSRGFIEGFKKGNK